MKSPPGGAGRKHGEQATGRAGKATSFGRFSGRTARAAGAFREVARAVGSDRSAGMFPLRVFFVHAPVVTEAGHAASSGPGSGLTSDCFVKRVRLCIACECAATCAVHAMRGVPPAHCVGRNTAQMKSESARWWCECHQVHEGGTNARRRPWPNSRMTGRSCSRGAPVFVYGHSSRGPDRWFLRRVRRCGRSLHREYSAFSHCRGHGDTKSRI